MNCAIRTYDLTKTFRRTPVLNGISLEVPAGSIYALVGPNGAGKTTTIKVLMNIFPPTSGRSEVLDADSRHLAPRHFAQIGYVSENQELPDWMTVGYFLDYLAPFYPTWDHALAGELLRQFQPRLIVLDEPFTGLDALVRDELILAVQCLSTRPMASLTLVSGNGASVTPTTIDRTEVYAPYPTSPWFGPLRRYAIPSHYEGDDPGRQIMLAVEHPVAHIQRSFDFHSLRLADYLSTNN